MVDDKRKTAKPTRNAGSPSKFGRLTVNDPRLTDINRSGKLSKNDPSIYNALLRIINDVPIVTQKVYNGNKPGHEIFIEENETSQIDEDELDARLLKLEEYAKAHAGNGVALYAKSLFPELLAYRGGRRDFDIAPSPQNLISSESNLEIPTAAPEKWLGVGKTRSPSGEIEDPTQFAFRVYGVWMGGSDPITTAHIRHLDEPLSRSIYHHVRAGKPVPEGFDLPSKGEQTTRWVSRVESEGLGALTEGKTGDEALREYHRFTSARHRRRVLPQGSEK